MLALMPENRTVTVSVPQHLANRMDDAIAAGAYQSNADVVREALKLWEQREVIKALETARLKAAYEDGIASGAGRTVTADGLIAGFKAKAARRG